MMQKVKSGRRMLSMLLAATFVFLQMFAGAPAASAASHVEVNTVNLLKHGDFEDTNVDLKPHQDPDQLDYWYIYPTGETKPVKVNNNAHTGEWAVKLSATEDAVEQDVAGLKEGATYIATVWAKATDPGSATAYFGVKNYGGSDIQVKIDSSEYKQYTIPFTYTGVSGKYPRIYVWVQSMSGGEIYVDDFSLIVDSDLQSLDIENGKLTAEYQADFAGTPSVEDFTATYRSSLAPDDVRPLALSQGNVDGVNMEMEFAPIASQPLAQTITVDVTYAPENQTITLDFPIEASGEPVVTAKIESLQAENGTLTAVLDKLPTVAPSADDFTVEYEIDNGGYQTLKTSDFSYDASARAVTFSFNRLASSLTDQNVTVKVTYQGEESTASFVIHAAEGVTYYVAADGSDDNDGMSEETPFQSIDKLNTITFQPGDQILFKKGDTFQGAFKPQGSGIEGLPIVVASYGEEGAPKPVLQPSQENWKTYVNVEYVTVNNGITFYNQSYWEVRDLELYDPDTTGEPNQSVFNRGINVVGKDAGELKHFYFDNLTIHGFHGPNSNTGKSSGGILMEVKSVVREPASKHIPTWINDIRITNCELYDLGRSGVNFLTVWMRRTETTDTKWGPSYPSSHGTNWPGYTRTPYQDFYLANNYIHNIDGDGCIVDTCEDAVLEHNLVYRCKENAPMAVGLFNWNSDNTIIQFNEVYETQSGSDAQGIEIDALNDSTYVQYNYLHDNEGGSIMWCNTAALYGFNDVFRYNIFQNDCCLNRQHGLLDIRAGTFNGQCYNNTFYMKPDENQIFISGTNSNSEISFYNNIFYYPGDEPFTANKFLESNIDWEANLFYNFTNVPSNDTSVITEDPLFVDPGKGGTGAYPGDVVDLSCYALQEGSPAIDAGIPIADNGGRDYFGNPVSGLPDIGAYDSGSISLKLSSSVYEIDQEAKTVLIPDSGSLAADDVLKNLKYEDGVTIGIYRGQDTVEGAQEIADNDLVKLNLNGQQVLYTLTIVHDPELLLLTSDVYTIDQDGQTIAIPEASETTVDDLLAGLNHRDGVTVQVKRGDRVLSGEEEILVGDSVITSKGAYQLVYLITVAHDASSDARDIPVSLLTATAGSVEPNNGGKPFQALDGNPSTIWHSKWAGDVRENLYITITISDDQAYMVDGLRYLPRSAGGTNGIITEYKIQYSTDGVNFVDVPGGTGTWGQTGWQDVQFAPVEAKAIRLYAVDSLSQEEGKLFATAAEVRLTGSLKTDDTTPPAAPTDVTVDAESLTETSAIIRWTAPADTDVAGYNVYVNDGTGDKLYYVANPKVTFLNLTDLTKDTTYTVKVIAVDTAGNQSPEAVATFTTAGAPVEEVNKSTLEYVIAQAQAHVDNGDVDKLVPSAKEMFMNVLNAAKEIYASETATQNEVDQAWKVLMTAIQGLDFLPGDKTELIDLVAEAKALDLNGYEDGAEKDAFTAALKAAEDLIADDDAMVLDIEAAYNALSDAMQNLIPKPAAGDKTELKKVIDEADIKNSELDRYVDDAEAKQKFADALAAAKEVYEKDGATQDEIDQAKFDLIDAMTGLRLRADKENLEQWLEDLKSIDLSQYTEESAAVVRAVIAKAEALAAQDLDENDQDLINAMVAEMAIAKAQLVPASTDPEAPENPNPGDGSGSGESSNPDTSKPNGDGSSQNGTNSEGKEATDKVPTTGDSTPITAISVMAVAAAGALWMLRKRKN